MSPRSPALALGLFAAAGCLGEGDDVPPPRLSTVFPDRGPPGLAVTLAGEHLCQRPEPEPDEDDDSPPCSPADATVWFDTTSAVSSVLGDEMASATVPAVAPGEVDVRIAVGGRTSNTLSFRIEVP